MNEQQVYFAAAALWSLFMLGAISWLSWQSWKAHMAWADLLKSRPVFWIVFTRKEKD